jgi:circadian clock protein KaiC
MRRGRTGGTMTAAKARPKAHRAAKPAPRDADVPRQAIPKAATGISGLDEITGGGLPAGRPTLVTGAAGCGKTLLGIEFLVHGALDHGEPGVLVSFEESAAELAANVRSLGFDLEKMQRDGLLVLDQIRVDPAQVVETGSYDLEGLFIRLASDIESVGAKRIVLDTVEVLFTAFQDAGVVRAELQRLFNWLKDRGMTTIVTGEPGADTLTRHGIEEYVSDCVITLDHRVREEVSTRRLRVVKYRGSVHGTNEYPFLINDDGLAVLPLSSLGLTYRAPNVRVLSGVPRLDHMLGGGYFQGSTVLISGDAGTGKTTLAAKSLEAACQRGERALLVTFEESEAQLVRDLSSVGIDLGNWIDAGLLRVWAARPSAYGLEAHLATLGRIVEDFEPTVVALDAMTALERLGGANQVTSALMREIDLLKDRGITAITTSLTHGGADPDETSGVAVASMMDTWLVLRNVESNGERNRLLAIRKSRGSAHSNQVREFVLTSDGPDLLDVYVGPAGVLTGSARLIQEGLDRQSDKERREDLARRRADLDRRAAVVEAQINSLRAEVAGEAAEIERLAEYERQRKTDAAAVAATLAAHRWADEPDSDGT